MTRIAYAALTAALLSLPSGFQAKVREAEAARLGQDLTPLGAEKKANADGSLPAWNDGHIMAKPADGQERWPESFPLYAKDVPLYTITQDNMAQHAAKLTTGAKALLARLPKSYKMPVYGSRRTANAPERIYEATHKNALSAPRSPTRAKVWSMR
ncbi:MAG: DUF1329 domain-containing protein [Panacagrimonas sp.]